MNKVVAAFTAVSKLLKTYPALSAALVNIGVVLLSYFGLHVSGEQLIYIVGIVSALLGVIVHSNVTPLAKLKVIPPAEHPVLEPPVETVHSAIVPLEGGTYKEPPTATMPVIPGK